MRDSKPQSAFRLEQLEPRALLTAEATAALGSATAPADIGRTAAVAFVDAADDQPVGSTFRSSVQPQGV